MVWVSDVPAFQALLLEIDNVKVMIDTVTWKPKINK